MNTTLKIKKKDPNVRRTGVTWTRGFNGGAMGQAVVPTVVKDIECASHGLWFQLPLWVKAG